MLVYVYWSRSLIQSLMEGWRNTYTLRESGRAENDANQRTKWIQNISIYSFFFFFFFLYRCHQITEWRQLGLDYIPFFSLFCLLFCFVFVPDFSFDFFVLFAGYFKQFKTHHQVRWLLVLNSMAWNRYYLILLTPPRPNPLLTSLHLFVPVCNYFKVILNQISRVMSGHQLRLWVLLNLSPSSLFLGCRYLLVLYLHYVYYQCNNLYPFFFLPKNAKIFLLGNQRLVVKVSWTRHWHT